MSFKHWKSGKFLQSRQGIALLGLLVCALGGSCLLPLLIELKAAVPSVSCSSSTSTSTSTSTLTPSSSSSSASASTFSAPVSADISASGCSSVPDPAFSVSIFSDTISQSPKSMSCSSEDTENKAENTSSFVCSEVIIDPEHPREELKRTSEYFVKRIPQLEKSLAEGRFYAKTVLLDESTKTSAYVYAVDENYADRLNGFFYYLIDETVSVSSLSPVVLTVSILFDEPDREMRIADGSFADPGILKTLEESLSALLGGLYDDRVLEFIYQNYSRIFAARIKGEAAPFCYYKLELQGLDVYFRNAFMTYIEFFVK